MERNQRPKPNKRTKQNQVEGSRLKQNTQRKKTNIVLNILIIIVTLLIIGSLYVVFYTTDKGTQPKEVKTASSTHKKEDAKKPKSEDEKKDEKQTSDDPNVKQVITKDWKVTRTEQRGNHVNSYDATSVDWKEKIKTFSSATGIKENNMTVWFVGRGKDPATESVGTISEKQTPDKAYRVYIAWRDGEGWQTTKMEELKSNDKR
ncbi:YrrS family protein [Listeria sp. PSOL-1]|uniref:YrrS family protein n=1 Tax=Listeria sp. PSOL-1 TaxID=1844999 RepID=UPI0013D15C7E|nr:YrrS family protein [Listeria sp. PSOL-1]